MKESFSQHVVNPTNEKSGEDEDINFQCPSEMFENSHAQIVFLYIL